jgi:plasmid rolling circle replication initiator protein Rep
MKVPYLKLVEFKGIGFDINCDPKRVEEDAFNYIQNEIKNNNKNGDYNDFFHCIWYCISGTRFEESEKSVLLKLSQVYNDKTIPIIIVYTQNIDNTVSNAMNKFIKDKGINTSFICFPFYQIYRD